MGVLALILVTGDSAAWEPGKIGQDPVLVQVTEASSLLYNVDNRDFRPNQVAGLANDHWGLWYNRFNAQASTGPWQLSLRLDTGWFMVSPNPTQIALDLTQSRPPGSSQPAPDYFRAKVNEAGVELSNRYINWTYPAKYALAYSTSDFEATLGDAYTTFGRGLVLSVRKVDELASDVTVRGARITGRLRLGSTKIRVTAVAGVMNPLRLDEASGRYLGVDASSRRGLTGIAEAGMPRAVATDFVPWSDSCQTFGTCAYAPDRVVGGQAEFSISDFKLATQGSLLLRQPALSGDVVRTANSIMTVSESLETPTMADAFTAYGEVALQKLTHEGQDHAVPMGHAVYTSLGYARKPVSVTFEGKHYRRLFPLLANVSLTRAREFGLTGYSAPPTTEALWVDTEFGGFNTCVTGGRARSDLQIHDHDYVYAWAGHYHTFAESVANETCVVSPANRNRVWDLAAGLEMFSENRRSRANMLIGGRFDNTDAVIEDTSSGMPTTVFYREGYTRYEILRHIGGPFVLEFQGWHRLRRQTVGGPGVSWFEGQHLTGFQWAPHFATALGFEYSTNPQVAPTYLNVQFVYKITPDTSLSLFVGQRRGALRCVGGVCRVYPPFEGARLDFTLRF
jgi:hypothetical protein